MKKMYEGCSYKTPEMDGGSYYRVPKGSYYRLTLIGPPGVTTVFFFHNFWEAWKEYCRLKNEGTFIALRNMISGKIIAIKEATEEDD
jgi:hypothetical protein